MKHRWPTALLVVAGSAGLTRCAESGAPLGGADARTGVDARSSDVPATAVDAPSVESDASELDAELPAADADADSDAALDAATPTDGRADATDAARDAGPLVYQNAVLDVSGDPFCARFGGLYYVYLPDQVRRDSMAVGGRVLGFTSRDLVRWTPLGEVFNNVDEAYGGQESIGLWAPEVLAHGGSYYLYYVNLMSNARDAMVGDKDLVVIRSNNPADFHNGTARTVLLDDAYAFIDPSPFQDPVTGQLFLYYKRRGALGTGSEIQVRPMSSPTAFSGPATSLVDSETFPNSDHVVEQPMMWRQNNVYYLLFSMGSGSGTGYQIAYGTSTQPTGPFAHRGVVFRSDLTGDASRRVISPGASTIVRDGAGRPWMVYRQKTTTADTFADRAVCIDPIEIDPAARTMRGTPTRGVTRPGPAPLPSP